MKINQKTNRQKGFTLAELLIVVAIIAVLVAIAVPIFNKKIEKSREAYDIATMRAAASAAMEMYYAGIDSKETAAEYGFNWWGTDGSANNNAYGAYDPGSGKFYDDKKKVKSYGEGTDINGGTKFTLGKSRGAYAPDQDYRKAVVMVSIYPYAKPAYAVVYWKNNQDSSNYVGGQQSTSVPKYSIEIPLE